MRLTGDYPRVLICFVRFSRTPVLPSRRYRVYEGGHTPQWFRAGPARRWTARERPERDARVFFRARTLRGRANWTRSPHEKGEVALGRVKTRPGRLREPSGTGRVRRSTPGAPDARRLCFSIPGRTRSQRRRSHRRSQTRRDSRLPGSSPARTPPRTRRSHRRSQIRPG